MMCISCLFVKIVFIKRGSGLDFRAGAPNMLNGPPLWVHNHCNAFNF